MRCAVIGGHKVEDEIQVIEDTLNTHDQSALKQRRLSHLNEGHQMHPFVLCFIEQFFDSTLIIADPAQRSEVLQ